MKNNIEKIRKGPCEFGAVTRNSLDNLFLEFRDFRKEIRNEFIELKKTNIELYNHLSDRLPKWAIVIGAIGAIIIGALFSSLINIILKGG